MRREISNEIKRELETTKEREAERMTKSVKENALNYSILQREREKELKCNVRLYSIHLLFYSKRQTE